MRIGIDIRSLSANRQTGVDEYICNLLPSLFREGENDQFHLLYNSFLGNIPEKIEFWKKFNNVEIYEYHWPSKLLNLSLWQLGYPKLDKLINKIDVFFLPNVTFSAFSKNIPRVVTFHDLSFEHFPEFFSPYGRLWHWLVNPRKQAKEASKIITVSRTTAEDIHSKYRIKRKNIVTIPLGLSPVFQKENKNKLEGIRKKYNLPQTPAILFLGTLEPRKNISSLILAFNEFKKRTGSPHCLILAGQPGWSFKKSLDFIKKSEFKDDIILPGIIDNEDRPSIYQMAEIFVFPSYLEGFGLPPLEAMASKTPVICSASSSLLEVFGRHALLINPHDIGELSWTIERVVGDKALQKSLILDGEKYAKKFSWEWAARRTLKVLHKTGRVSNKPKAS